MTDESQTTGWQPIATAPKDGKPILMGSRDHDNWPSVYVGSWNDGWQEDAECRPVSPTWWMPIQELPQ